MSDRTYFTAHRDGAAGGRFVSEPFQGRASGYWEFAVSERVSGSAGRFAGVLAAKMDVEYFDRLYHSLDIGRDAFVELATTDGKVITRVPAPREGSALLGAEADGALAALKRDGRFTGWSHGVGQAGADPVLISSAAIPALPLDVVVGAPERAVLAPWRAETVRIGLRTILTSAAMLALVVLAARELARRAAADERTRQSEEALRRRQEMLDLAHHARAGRSVRMAARRGRARQPLVPRAGSLPGAGHRRGDAGAHRHRARPPRAPPPTGSADRAHERLQRPAPHPQALGAGVSELLKKPVQSRELAAALARVLRRAA
jgi:hypothetical protein